MTTPYASLRDVTVEQFRAALLGAASLIDVVQPEELREPISLWLRGLEERARREGWRSLVGKPVEYAWEAAQAILNCARELP